MSAVRVTYSESKRQTKVIFNVTNLKINLRLEILHFVSHHEHQVCIGITIARSFEQQVKYTFHLCKPYFQLSTEVAAFTAFHAKAI